MADCAAIPSCAYLQMRRTQSRCMARNMCKRILQRQHLSGSCGVVGCFPSAKAHMSFYPLRIKLKENLWLKESSLRCCCLGTFTNSTMVVPSNWVLLVDQALLMASIVLAYMAGVIPHDRVSFGAKNSSTAPDSAADSTSYDTKSETDTSIKDSWGEVKGKLADALDAFERNDSLDGRVESSIKRHPSNLFAIFEGPRLRLLCATLQQLQKEVTAISKAYEVVTGDVLLAVSSEVIKGCIQPVCVKWMEEELVFENIEPDKKLFSRISAILKGDDTILHIVNRLGKAELYAETLYFLRFGYLRMDCYYDSKFLTLHGIDILEDLVVTVADGIASIYLELISVDSNISTEMNGFGTSLCNLSTRLLQRLRNEVALSQWLQQNFESVVSMYEDRFELFVLRREQLVDTRENQSERRAWWSMFAFEKKTYSSLHYVQIRPFALPVKRTKELRALTGWKYYFSLCLEFSDISMPLVRVVFIKIRSAVTFFLVSLIGRSLGLIYSGIRQSIGWR